MCCYSYVTKKADSRGPRATLPTYHRVIDDLYPFVHARLLWKLRRVGILVLCVSSERPITNGLERIALSSSVLTNEKAVFLFILKIG